MSRTTQKKTSSMKSPVKFYIEFKGDTGTYTYSVKNEDGSYETKKLDQLKFILIETKASIIGWSDEHGKKIFSNLVDDSKKEEFQLKVKTSGGKIEVLAQGLYSDNKEKFKALGGKFCTNLFALAEIDGQYEPVILQVSKNSQAEWSRFTKDNPIRKLYDSIIIAGKGGENKKGRVVYFAPLFETAELPSDLAELADNFDKNELTPYFKSLSGEVEQAEETEQEQDEDPCF